MPEGQIEPVAGNLGRLLEKVNDDRGLDLTNYRPRYVERRVAVRLNHLGINSYTQYSLYLDQHPDEYTKLLDALTINVTQFFRDPTTYAFVREQVVPTVLKAKMARNQRLLRVWSAGCATGEETYSLAMLLLDAIRMRGARDVLLTVIGTDIDKAALAKAKSGEFPLKALSQIPRPDRLRYTDAENETFHFKPEVMKVVRFQPLNLFEEAPIHGIDMIFCRNVFIYFNRDQQERLIRGFKKSLVRGGYLVLGRSERLSSTMSGELEIVSSRERVYRKPLGLL